MLTLTQAPWGNPQILGWLRELSEARAHGQSERDLVARIVQLLGVIISAKHVIHGNERPCARD